MVILAAAVQFGSATVSVAALLILVTPLLTQLLTLVHAVAHEAAGIFSMPKSQQGPDCLCLREDAPRAAR